MAIDGLDPISSGIEVSGDDAPLDDRTQPAVDFAELTAADAPAIHALYKEVLATVPYGFLAERSEADFHDFLSCSHLSASVGAWSNGELVAYAISSPETARAAMEQRSPLLALLAERQCLLMGIRGYGVSPRAKGHRIGFRLIAVRKEIAKAKGLQHFVATGAVGNLSSLNAGLRSGGWLVGLIKDEYCDNFITYAGPLTEELETTGTKLVPVTDLESLQFHFERGWIGTAISDYKSGRVGLITLRRCRTLC